MKRPEPLMYRAMTDTGGLRAVSPEDKDDLEYTRIRLEEFVKMAGPLLKMDPKRTAARETQKILRLACRNAFFMMPLLTHDNQIAFIAHDAFNAGMIFMESLSKVKKLKASAGGTIKTGLHRSTEEAFRRLHQRGSSDPTAWEVMSELKGKRIVDVTAEQIRWRRKNGKIATIKGASFASQYSRWKKQFDVT